MNQIPAYMLQPIKSTGDALKFILALEAADKLFHFDDSPDTIVEAGSGARTFAEAECEPISDRVEELFSLGDFDPFGVCVSLMRAQDMSPEGRALLLTLLVKYPDVKIGVTLKSECSIYEPEPPESLITIEQGDMCIVDPLSPSGGFGLVDCVTEHGISEEDARAIRAYNKVVLG
jgi:hypothetical protein